MSLRPDARLPFWLFCLALLWLTGLPRVAAQPAGGVLPVPALTARVIDQTGTLDAPQRRHLEDKLAAFEATHGTQIIILMVPSTQPEDVASYANRVFNSWKPGRPGVGDGLLLVVAKQDRKMRIEVARALEGAVPDLAAKRIIDELLTPHFRQGDFAVGLDLASERLMTLIRGEALPAPVPSPNNRESDWMKGALLLFIALPVIASVTRRLLGHKLGSLTTAGLIGLVAYALTASLLLALAASVLALLLAFVSGTALGSALLSSSRQRQHGNPWGAYGHGGGWGGGSGGGFGGGGFSSGGGGDGAGGGASGDW